MAKRNEKDYLYLVWKEPKTRRQYTIATLSKNGQYEFEYGLEVEEAIQKGFKLMIAFKELEKKYESKRLFASFSSRIPDRRRRDIDVILKKYDLVEYDEYELLKKSGGRLPIDNLGFIDPIMNNGENPIERSFYVAGSGHHLGCEKKDCLKSIELKIGSKLYLKFENTNKHDVNAIEIIDYREKRVGYIPRYYNCEIRKLLNEGWEYDLIVKEFLQEKKCNECLLAKLKLKK
jgi:hypothetical protein